MTVVNKLNPNCLLESKRHFRPDSFQDRNHPCWGWSKFVSHEELFKYGFVSTDGTDTVTIRFLVRRENFCKKAMDL